jgi:hypothetical protein
MRLVVDTSKVTFTVTKNPEPKTDQQGQQRFRKNPDGSRGEPMWATQVMALDETGGEVISVTVAGAKPEATVGQMVAPVGLEAIPWATNGRSGIAYRASDLRPVNGGK